MTQEAQCIAIAQACGYSTHECPDGLIEWRWPSGSLIGRYPQGQCPSIVPNYTTDLNAMREAVMSLPDRNPYLRELQIVTADWKNDPEDEHWLDRMTNASAAQCAESFLRTLNLWRDDA